MNFKMCWIFFTQFFNCFDHNVDNTAGNKYMRLRLPTMLAGKKLDFVVNVALREKILWLQQVLTMPGAEMHAPGADTADGYLHAMGRCFLCNFLNEEVHVHYR